MDHDRATQFQNSNNYALVIILHIVGSSVSQVHVGTSKIGKVDCAKKREQLPAISGTKYGKFT